MCWIDSTASLHMGNEGVVACFVRNFLALVGAHLKINFTLVARRCHVKDLWNIARACQSTSLRAKCRFNFETTYAWASSSYITLLMLRSILPVNLSPHRWSCALVWGSIADVIWLDQPPSCWCCMAASLSTMRFSRASLVLQCCWWLFTQLAVTWIGNSALRHLNSWSTSVSE